jgi:SAM-dependent methyltransferase
MSAVQRASGPESARADCRVVTRDAYSRRAAEYIDLLGSMDAVHPSDLQVVSTWASEVDGEILDAGCGPGHWTDFLVRRGYDARGIDQVPEFIEHARVAHPTVDYSLGSLDSLDVSTGSLGGLLSWYSVIHDEPETVQVALREFGRVVKPGGSLLIGFFEGPVVEEFAHAVTPAYRWPVDALSAELGEAGFDVVESHVRKTAGQRSLASIEARRRGND